MFGKTDAGQELGLALIPEYTVVLMSVEQLFCNSWENIVGTHILKEQCDKYNYVSSQYYYTTTLLM